MSMGNGDCIIDKSILEDYNKNFRFSKADHSIALLLKIDVKDMTVVVDEEYRDPNTTLELIAEDLEESTPRFILYSYKWVISDRYGDRKQFPITLIFYSPEGGNTYHNMVYTRSKTVLLQKFPGIQRAYDIRDKESLSDEWLLAQLNKK